MRLPLLALLLASPATAQILPPVAIGNTGSAHTRTLPDPVDQASVARGDAWDLALGRQSGGGYDVHLFSMPGTVDRGGTLVLDARVVNVQGTMTPFFPIVQTYSGVPGDATNDAISLYSKAITIGPRGGNGFRFDMLAGANNGGAGTQFAVTTSQYADCSALRGGQCLAGFALAQSPVNRGTRWGVFGMEINSINLAGNTGWANRRMALSNWTGQLQLVPESHDFLTNTKAGGYNSLFGAMCAHSAAISAATGYYTQNYNCLLGEPDAIAPGGMFIQASGGEDRTATATLPKSVIHAEGAWSTAAIDTRDATFSSGSPIMLAAGQSACFAGTDGCVRWVDGKLTYMMNGNAVFSVDDRGNLTLKGTLTQKGIP